MRKNAQLKDELEGDTSTDLPSPSLCGSILDSEEFLNILDKKKIWGEILPLANKRKGLWWWAAPKGFHWKHWPKSPYGKYKLETWYCISIWEVHTWYWYKAHNSYPAGMNLYPYLYRCHIPRLHPIDLYNNTGSKVKIRGFFSFFSLLSLTCTSNHPEEGWAIFG